MSERRRNPFGWIVLGFVVGVLSAFGAMAFLTPSQDEYESHPIAIATAADDAAIEAMDAAPAAPRKIDISAPAPADPVAAPKPEPAVATSKDLDPQVADDAAAAGMTSRAQ
jgi:hypothetical protein